MNTGQSLRRKVMRSGLRESRVKKKRMNFRCKIFENRGLKIIIRKVKIDGRGASVA